GLMQAGTEARGFGLVDRLDLYAAAPFPGALPTLGDVADWKLREHLCETTKVGVGRRMHPLMRTGEALTKQGGGLPLPHSIDRRLDELVPEHQDFQRQLIVSRAR